MSDASAEVKPEAVTAEPTKAEPTQVQPAKVEDTKVAAPETGASETTKVEAPKAETVTAEAPKTEAAAAAAAPSTPVVSPIQALWAAAKENGHPEIWGVTLADPEGHVPTQIILQKYLNANDGDLVKAKDQLVKTLEWRAKTNPLDLVKKEFSKTKFDGLGYVTTYKDETAEDPAAPESKEVFTWNVYGATKNIDETFGVLDE